MTILNTISLESNRKNKINFNGGDLSSDGGLLLIKEFASRIGFLKLIKKLFKKRCEKLSLLQYLFLIISRSRFE